MPKLGDFNPITRKFYLEDTPDEEPVDVSWEPSVNMERAIQPVSKSQFDNYFINQNMEYKPVYGGRIPEVVIYGRKPRRGGIQGFFNHLLNSEEKAEENDESIFFEKWSR